MDPCSIRFKYILASCNVLRLFTAIQSKNSLISIVAQIKIDNNEESVNANALIPW